MKLMAPVALTALAMAIPAANRAGEHHHPELGPCVITEDGSMFLPAHLSKQEREDFRKKIGAFSAREKYEFTGAPRRGWTTTSTGGTVTRGEPFTLTYSFIPDGTNIPTGVAGENASPSNLFAQMNANMPIPEEQWKDLFHRTFERWEELTGVQFVEVPDDGAPFPITGGQPGVRGDIRIGMHSFQPSGGGAYNYFPNNGDMVLNSDIMHIWANSFEDFRLLRNVVSHELGHAFSLEHVTPEDSSKIMEATVPNSIEGPQDDDIRGAQFLMGDRFAGNGSAATATDLGTYAPGDTLTFAELALEDAARNDYYRLRLNAETQLALTLAPVGAGYDVGPENGTPGPVDTAAIQDLAMELTQNGTPLATAAAGSAGQPESLGNVSLPAGTYGVRVFSQGGPDDVQRYELTIDLPLSAKKQVAQFLVRLTSDSSSLPLNNDNIIDAGDIVNAGR